MIPALQDKINQFQADADLAHEIVNGSATTVVETAGGPVCSFAKAIADFAAYAPVVSGQGAPSDSFGVDGQFYIDTKNSVFYGPKEGTWPAGLSLIGDVTPAALQALQQATSQATLAAQAAESAQSISQSVNDALALANASANQAAQSAASANQTLIEVGNAIFPTSIDGGDIRVVQPLSYQFFGVDGGMP